MQNYYDQRGSNNAHTNTALPADYLNFIASTLNNNELLNSSFNLKKSMNNRDWLNNSMNLPPELRYQHLNVMVDEITQDDLLNSTNSLNFSMKSLTNKNKRHGHQQPANVQYRDKENNQFKMQTKLNDLSNNNIQFFNQKQLPCKPNLQDSISQRNMPQMNQNNVPYEIQNQNIEMNGVNNINKLVYPPSFSHQFSTLTMEQHNYLLQQQRQLFLSLNTNNYLEQQAQNQQIQYQRYLLSQGPYQGYNYHNVPNNNKAMNFNNTQNMSYENQQGKYQNDRHNMTLVSSSSSTLSSPTSPQSNSISDPHQAQLQHDNTYDQNNQENIPYQMNFNNNMNYGNKMMMDQNSLVQINFANQNRYLYKQPYRHHRRTGPANELHVRLEECLYQLKSLETERKKIEIEQSSLNTNKKQPQINLGTQIPRLSSNPSRVDRLIVEALREYGKLWALISKLENLSDTIFYPNIQSVIKAWLDKIHNVQAKRKDEVMNGLERQRMGQPMRLHDDQEIIGLANAINELVSMTSKIRTAIWCAIQISNVNYKQSIPLKNDQFVLQSQASTNNFIEQTFKLKTDLKL